MQRVIGTVAVVLPAAVQTTLLALDGRWPHALFFGVLVPAVGLVLWFRLLRSHSEVAWAMISGVLLMQIAVFVFGV